MIKKNIPGMGINPMPGMKPCRFSNSGIKKFRDQCPGTFQQISNDAEGHELAIPAQATATLISPGRRSRKARHFKYIHKKAPKIFEAFLAVRTGLEPATPCVTGMYSNQLNYRTFLRYSFLGHPALCRIAVQR